MLQGIDERRGCAGSGRRALRRAVVLAGLVSCAAFAGSSAGLGAGSGLAHAASSSSKSGAVLATVKVLAPGVEIQAKNAKAFTAAKDGQQLQQGDALKTDATGKAEIAYTDGSLTRLGESTEFVITKLTDKKGARQTQGTLTVGSTWNRAAKVSESGEFSIKAGGATAAVEGTAFVVTCPAAGSTAAACTVTAIVDSISVDSDEWTVTSVTDVE